MRSVSLFFLIVMISSQCCISDGRWAVVSNDGKTKILVDTKTFKRLSPKVFECWYKISSTYLEQTKFARFNGMDRTFVDGEYNLKYRIAPDSPEEKILDKYAK